MSAQKKGKDLSALKARLAKKAAAAAEPEAPAPGGDVPAPGEPAPAIPAPGEVKADVPAPGEVKKPVDIPAPGEVKKPIDIPAPGEVAQPAPEPAAAAAEAKKGDIADDPLSGGVAFNPDAGLIDDVGGELKPKGGGGLAIFTLGIGIVVGAGLGYMGHKASDSRKRVAAAREKAEVIQEKVVEIQDQRAGLSLQIGDVEDALTAKDGEKAAAALETFEPTFIELGDLFGWQMAAMDSKVIKAIFDLAETNNSLQIDVGILKAWVGANKDVLAKRAKGPSTFVVLATPQGMVLGEYVAAICDEIPAEPPEDFKLDSLKECSGEGGIDEIVKAPAYKVRQAIGGPVSVVPAGQAMFLNPSGPIYSYAIGANPEANAKAYFDLRMGKLKGALEDMAKLEEEALKGIGNYTEDPKVDGE